MSQPDLCQSTELDKLDYEWSNINWNHVIQSIFKLQQRINHAEETKEFRRVRNLTRLLLNNNRRYNII